MCSIKHQKAEKTKHRDEKRRRMAEDLERRERQAEAQSAESFAKMRLQQQIERLRRAAAAKEVAFQQQMHQKSAAVTEKKVDRGASDDQLARSLKLKWDAGHEEYNDAFLRSLCAKYGTVEDIVLRESKKGGSALVVMETREGCQNILRGLSAEALPGLKVRGLRVDSPVRMKEFETEGKKSRGNGERLMKGTTGVQRQGPLFPAASSASAFDTVGSRGAKASDFETQVLFRMKEEARKRAESMNQSNMI